MLRPSIVRALAASTLGLSLLAGCGAGTSGTTMAPVGHDGQSATGHSGAGPAGGPTSPEGKKHPAKPAA